MQISILGAFAKLRRTSISFIVSVRPSVGMEQLGNRWTNCHEIWYLIFFFPKLCRENSVLIAV